MSALIDEIFFKKNWIHVAGKLLRMWKYDSDRSKKFKMKAATQFVQIIINTVL